MIRYWLDFFFNKKGEITFFFYSFIPFELLNVGSILHYIKTNYFLQRFN